MKNIFFKRLSIYEFGVIQNKHFQLYVRNIRIVLKRNKVAAVSNCNFTIKFKIISDHYKVQMPA